MASAVLMTILKAAVAVSDTESVTRTVKLAVPVVVGTPEITPVAAARVKPAGSVPALRLQL